MNNLKNIKFVLLFIYIIGILIFYVWLFYPLLTPPKGLIPTQIQSLSVTGLMEANRVFTASGKSWIRYPAKPDKSLYSFGQSEPIQITNTENSKQSEGR